MGDAMQRLAGNKYVVGCVIFLIVAIAAFGCGKGRHGYTVGVISNFEGSNAQPSIFGFNAIKLAYEESRAVNPASPEIELLAIDNSFDPEKTRHAYASIADKCDIVIFLTTSTSFLAVYDDVLKNPAKLHCVIGPTTTIISGHDDNIIRGSIDLEQEQKNIAWFLNKKSAGRTLVFLETESNRAYTEPAYKAFSRYFKGPAIVSRFSARRMDIEKGLDILRRGGVGFVYILAGGASREAGLIIQNVRKINPTIGIMNTLWVTSTIFEEAAGKSDKNVFIPSQSCMSEENPRYMNFKNAYEQHFGPLTGYYAPAAYDMAKILFDALEKTGKARAPELKSHILSRKYQTSMGTISFDKYGDLESRLYYYSYGGRVYEKIE